MIREVKFESQDRRIKQILAVLNAEGIQSIEEANQICEAAGLDPYKTCEETQPICFENAKWAYVVGAAIAIKRGCTNAADAAEAIGVGLQAFCIPGSVADDRKVGLGHGNLAARLLREETKCFAFLAGHYYAAINSMSAYYKHNMELLQKEVRQDLFGERDIYTKVRDSAPSKYGKDAVVKNSLISDGCEIEGVVENSILFRGVKVGKGAVVRNSVIMQDNIIGQNTSLNCVITDKNVVVSDRTTLGGCADLPYYIPKGTRL